MNSSGRDSPESKRLDRLAEIVRETGDVVKQSVDSLSKTELSKQQQSFISAIQEKNEESLKAATDLASQEEIFVEVKEKQSRGHRPA